MAKSAQEFFNTFPKIYSDRTRAPNETADDIRTKMGTSDFIPPTLFILSNVKERLDLYIQCARGEISGLGEVSQMGRNFLITAVHLFEQKSTDSDTKLEKSAIHDHLYHAIRNGINPVSLKLWWHSHGDGNVFWSGTDDRTIAGFKNWMISIVGNKKGEYLTRLDICTPIHLTVENLEFLIRLPENELLRKEIEREVVKKVKQGRMPPIPYYSYHPHSPMALLSRRTLPVFAGKKDARKWKKK